MNLIRPTVEFYKGVSVTSINLWGYFLSFRNPKTLINVLEFVIFNSWCAGRTTFLTILEYFRGGLFQMTNVKNKKKSP